MVAVKNDESQGNPQAAEVLRAEGGAATAVSSPLSEAPREVLSLEVEYGSEAPAVVRTALSELRELGPARDDVILVASELVTNAVVHSGGSPGDTIHVLTRIGPDRVSISVHDPGLSGDRPRVRASDELQAHGWGLRIVSELAHRWGAERDRGYRVWAELRLPDPAQSGGG